MSFLSRRLTALKSLVDSSLSYKISIPGNISFKQSECLTPSINFISLDKKVFLDLDDPIIVGSMMKLKNNQKNQISILSLTIENMDDTNKENEYLNMGNDDHIEYDNKSALHHIYNKNN